MRAGSFEKVTNTIGINLGRLPQDQQRMFYKNHLRRTFQIL